MLEKRRHEIFLTLGAFFFAVNGVPAKLLLGSTLSSLRLTEARTICGFLILLIWMLIKDPKALKISKKEIPWLIAFGLIGFTCVNTFYFLSIHRLKVSIALLVEFTSPIWIALYLRFIRKVKVSSLMWWGLLISLLGLILLAQVWQGLTLDALGLVFAFIDAFSMCGYFLLGERLTKRHPTEVILVWGMGISSLFFAIAQPIWSFPFDKLKNSIPLEGALAGHHLPAWALLTFVFTGGMVIPYFFVIAGLRGLSASISSVLGMLEPVFAGAIAWWLLNESLSAVQLLGAAVILIGIFLADRARIKV
jgi:drug/metabolite transporter (DMT)-like permease